MIMGVKHIMTTHSLLDFSTLDRMLLSKLNKIGMIQTDAMINVSNMSRKNFVLRTGMDPSKCYVIPNAVDCTKFTPDPSLIYP